MSKILDLNSFEENTLRNNFFRRCFNGQNYNTSQFVRNPLFYYNNSKINIIEEKYNNNDSDFKYNNNNNDNLFIENSKNIVSIGGKKYLNFNNKFHTFGGIKNKKFRYENIENYYKKYNNNSNNNLNFSKLKYQTFGGIKRSQIDVNKYCQNKKRKQIPFNELYPDVKLTKKGHEF